MANGVAFYAAWDADVGRFKFAVYPLLPMAASLIRGQAYASVTEAVGGYTAAVCFAADAGLSLVWLAVWAA